ncbi:hypothetical protein J437_LFUL010592 [Ladona fulva]|uniref:LIM zinc-binding domain-containing protein n=1 Tax=Ladona fulva TaxID=123851 RepID=A0A8K0P2N7_LADFU|nr:hypothetical protein J437_LFUL010592 [Ladona fulva]
MLPMNRDLKEAERNKDSYYQRSEKIFGVKRCARCHDVITSSELVMRARDLVFHVRCFTCAACGTPLSKGDQFGMRSSSVFCRLHLSAGGEGERGGEDCPSGGRSGSPGELPPPLVPGSGEAAAPAFPSPASDSEFVSRAEERRLRLGGATPSPPRLGMPTAVPPSDAGGGAVEVPFYNGISGFKKPSLIQRSIIQFDIECIV